MTKRKRRNHSPVFKAKVALAAVRGERTRTTRRARPPNAGPSESICKGGDGGTARQHYGINRASLRDEFPLSGDRVPHRRTTSTP